MVAIKVIGNKNPSGQGQCGRIYSDEGILGSLNVAKGTIPNIATKARIRRLTPRECWRLQGFPDSYFDKAKAAGISDTQLYKMAGNAVTVNVAFAIGQRLKEIENEKP